MTRPDARSGECDFGSSRVGVTTASRSLSEALTRGRAHSATRPHSTRSSSQVCSHGGLERIALRVATHATRRNATAEGGVV